MEFLKMHGLGNDFVIFDADALPSGLTAEQIARIADRHQGVGCDQLIVIEPSGHADAFMRIYNADGSEAGACGNATRCIAALLHQRGGGEDIAIETISGILKCRHTGGGRYAVDMGPARLNWQDIPLAEAHDTLHVPLTIGPASAPVLKDPCCVSMGNPHAVFFVEDAEAIDLGRAGPLVEHDPLFPDRVNVSVVSLAGKNHLRQRVWERGAGITQACGSGACAAAVAAARRGLTGRRVRIGLDGGTLDIHWREDNHVIMTGPASISFRGQLAQSLLDPSVPATADLESV